MKLNPQSPRVFGLIVMTCLIQGLLGLSVAHAVSIQPSKKGLYLSFEEKWMVARMLQIPRSESPRQAFDEAMSELKQIALRPREVVNVKTFKDFLASFRGEWPNTGDLNQDLKEIAKSTPAHLRIFKSNDTGVQSQISRYIIERPVQLLQKLKAPSEVMLPEQLLQNMDITAERKMILWRAFQNLLKAEFEKTAEKISSLTEGGDGTRNEMSQFIKKAMRSYLENLPETRKEYIFLQFLSDDLNMSDLQRMELLIQNSGPQLQKLLQVLSRDESVGPELGVVFKQLEDSVKPVSPILAQKIIESEKNNYQIVRWERKPIGVGTMAQVHRGARVESDGQEVAIVIRFLKPGIKARVIEDQVVMTAVAKMMDQDQEVAALGLPKLEPLVEDITKSVFMELDLEATKTRQLMAGDDYDSMFLARFPTLKTPIRFAVPGIHEPLHLPSQLMVQDLVIGKKMDKELIPYSELMPTAKQQVAEKLAELWIESALFKNGFFHADLHHGNLLVSVREPETLVYILDYGMGGILDPQLQKAINSLGVGALFSRPDIITDSLWRMSDSYRNLVSYGVFKNQLYKKMSEQSRPLQIEEWVTWSLDHGLRLHSEIVNLQRGLLTVSQMLKDSGSKMTNLELSIRLARKYPRQMYDLCRFYGINWTDILKGSLETIRSSSRLRKANPSLPIDPSGQANKPVTNRCEVVLD